MFDYNDLGKTKCPELDRIIRRKAELQKQRNNLTSSIGFMSDGMFCSLMSLITFVINSSGLFLNIANLIGLIPCKMAATVFLVSTVPSAILPIKSYLIWLVSECLSVVVLDFASYPDAKT